MEYGIVIYLLFLLGSFILWFLVPTYSIFMLFMMLLILLLLDCTLLFISMRKATLTCTFKNQIVNRNSMVVMQVNRHVSFPYAIGTISGEYSMQLVNQDIKPYLITNTSWQQEIILVAKHCGIHTFAMPSIRLYDLLHIFYIQKRIDDTKEIVVLPTIQEVDISILDERYNSASRFDNAIVKPGDDLSEIFELRKYREGDVLKQIHWKASLKINDILVKVGSESGDVAITLGLLVSADINSNDKTMDMFHSLCLALLSQQRNFCIALYHAAKKQIELKTIDNEEQYYQVVFEILTVLDRPYTLQELKQANSSDSIFVVDHEEIHVIDGGIG